MTRTDVRSSDDTALGAYTRSMRRARLIYAVVLSVIAIVLAVVVAVAWSHGEITHTTLHTAASAPPSLPVTTPPARLNQAWSTPDRLAIGVPQWGGTVITWSAHAVRGRDARTGTQTWSYARSDRTMCTAAQAGGTTLALFEVNGNCDELTALDSQTGQRRFTRTLDKDGMPVNGHPAYQVLSYTFMVTSPDVIYAIDPVTGYDRWTYTRQGCAIGGAVLGSSGALISQTCTSPDCGTEKYCGRGPQLMLRDGVNGRDDKSTTNPDKIKWNLIGNTDTPVSADAVIAGFNTTIGTLDTFDATNGRSRSSLALSPPPVGSGIAASALTGTELVWLGGVTYAVPATGSTTSWSVRTAAAPTLHSSVDADTPPLSTARIVAAAGGEIRVFDGTTGRVTARYAVRLPAGASVYSLGSGFLVSGRDVTAAYR